MGRAWSVPEKGSDQLPGEMPRISNKPVRIDNEQGMAYYKRSAQDQRHPDAAYSMPDTQNPGGRVDVILLGLILFAVVGFAAVVASCLTGVPLF